MLWDGYGDLGPAIDGVPRGAIHRTPAPPKVPAELVGRTWAYRHYLVFRGPLDALSRWFEWRMEGPNYVWPDDRAWIVATEIDGFSTCTIYKDVVDMMAARQIWEGFQAIVEVAPDDAKKYGTFHSWFNGSYIRSQALAIRRQVEVRDDVVSLGRLLDRITKAPNVLTRDRYLAELHPDDHRMGNRFFDMLTTPGSKAIDASVPAGQLTHLRDETANIRKWADKEIAHYDPNTGEFGKGPTFGSVHDAIDLIFETLNHYNQLILGSTMVGSVVMPPWQAVFKVAWIPNDAAYKRVADLVRENDQRRMGG
jgi:hypothetical protein